MEFIILGLLILKPQTGYEISSFIKNNLSMICSSSAGSVQTAIKKLLLNECISFEQVVENNKNKKIFKITKKGNIEFNNWIRQPMESVKVKNMQLSKLFFLGFSDKESRILSIKQYIEQLKTTEKTLLFMSDFFKKNRCDIAIDSDILDFQGYTLDYGVSSAKFEIEWYSNILKQMEEN